MCMKYSLAVIAAEENIKHYQARMKYFTKTWIKENFPHSSSIVFVVVVTIESWVLCEIVDKDPFSSAQFMMVGKDKVFIGHVVATYVVEDFHQCGLSCASNPKCKAINYEYSTVNSSLQKCELNDATKTERPPEFYIYHKGFSYYEIVTDSQPQTQSHETGKKINLNCPDQHDGASCQIFCVQYPYLPKTDPKTCKDYHTTFGYRHDGEYLIYLDWPECTNAAVIYCANMESTPLEYISLPEHKNNYGGSHNKNKMREEKTYFEKIRFLLSERRVKRNDFAFATTNYPGTARRPYAEARDCFSNSCSAQKRKGSFKVDLTGTSFHLPQVIAYDFYSFPVCVRKVFAASMSSDNLRWSGKCGGSCGSCWPKSFTLLLNGC
ncbi:uncharacterized protein LOC114533424 [Dendronephthya gigantea]|uniref:uncharacterized protein LOC114533424 n=1 Tax=Dendronephthya gigantea TaxID=151771 RepID=UPI00106B4564|nr:uncharacterized protein LOC114533424 [Dendronephthya gigantea]